MRARACFTYVVTSDVQAEVVRVRLYGALASIAPTDDQGNHAKGRCLDPARETQRPVVGSFVQRTLPTAGTVGRAERQAVDRLTPVAARDSGPPLGERQVARERSLC